MIAIPVWVDVMKASSWMDYGSSVCCHKSALVVVGARDATNGKHLTIRDCSFTKQVSRPLPGLPVTVQYTGVLNVDSDIYVIVGKRCSNGRWCKSTSMTRLCVGRVTTNDRWCKSTTGSST